MAHIVPRGAAGYEPARRDAVKNARTPPRRPAEIVLAEDAGDVELALSRARKQGRKVAVRSGGHSWAGSHLRDDGVLIDVSRMTAMEIDAGAMTATVEPGRRSSELMAALFERDLFFPTGHCVGPAVGGFLLQGGFGWNSRRVGPGCMNVEAVDVVTAGGELVRADAEEHPDLFWAARGAGPGFFGAVVRYHLRLHRRPPVQLATTHGYPVGLLDEVLRWAHAVGPEVSDAIELMVFLRRGLLGGDDPALFVVAPALADSEEEARDALALLETCPVRDRATVVEDAAPVDVREHVRRSEDFYPEGHRYAVDNMWTHAPVEELLPGYRRIAATLPSSPSHMMWMNWHPPAQRPDMAFSLEDETYVALYGVWPDAADDERFADWATERMTELEPLASGIQLADENLGRRPAAFLSPGNLERLEAIRRRYDPEGRFCSWMAPASAER